MSRTGQTFDTKNSSCRLTYFDRFQATSLHDATRDALSRENRHAILSPRLRFDHIPVRISMSSLFRVSFEVVRDTRQRITNLSCMHVCRNNKTIGICTLGH